MKHIFGPVHSRRLGRSLGIDLFVEKICNLDCIYCEVGKHSTLFGPEAVTVPVDRIVTELEHYFLGPGKDEHLDAVTITASGEPTLHGGLGEIGQRLRGFTARPIVVLTNATTLHLPEVRESLGFADIVIPSLDSAIPASFRKVNRPAPGVKLEQIITGLTEFTRGFSGAVWLEVLLVQGINDSDEDISALTQAIGCIRPDKIQLNTVLRPPLENFAKPLSTERMAAVAATIRTIVPGIPLDLPETGGPGKTVDTMAVSALDNDAKSRLLERILQTVARRPCTAEDINTIFSVGGSHKVEQLLAPLVDQNRLKQRTHRAATYYQA